MGYMTEEQKKEIAEQDKRKKIGCIIILIILGIVILLAQVIGTEVMLGIGVLLLIVAIIAVFIYASKLQ